MLILRCRDDRLFYCSPPAFANQVPECGGSRPVDRHLYIMERRIGITSGIHPPGIIWGVLRGIPPALREVYSAYKGNSIIHDHDLLVVRGADRMVSVQPEMNAPMGLPLEIENGKQLPLQRVDHGEIPIQYMYIQAWLP
jgi:hypothetical protein